MCLYPRLIKNRKYVSNKKNGGNIPTVSDERTRYVPVGCQDCIECRKQKARSWQIRLLEDIKTNTNGKFITLTFSDQSYADLAKEIEESDNKEKIETPKGYILDNKIATLAIRRFNERWRQKHGKALRHWLVTELGHKGTENIHLHGIIWTNTNNDTIKRLWNYGFIWIGKYVNAMTVNYIVKYVNKRDLDHKAYKSIVLTSPGIGGNYMHNEDWKKNKYNGINTIETYRTETGHKTSMPIYWRNKIYTEEEREKLWLQRLDKEERWVCGQRIDMKKNEKDYDKIVKFYRKRNKELGYGNGEVTSDVEQYERQRRILIQQTRIAKAYKKTPSAGS